MYLSNLKFFKDSNEAVQQQNILANMNLMAANLKNNTLRRMLYAYLQQELERLARNKKSNEDKAKKQKRLFARLKLVLSKGREKKRSHSRIDPGFEPATVKQKREKPAVRCSMK